MKRYLLFLMLLFLPFLCFGQPSESNIEIGTGFYYSNMNNNQNNINRHGIPLSISFFNYLPSKNFIFEGCISGVYYPVMTVTDSNRTNTFINDTDNYNFSVLFYCGLGFYIYSGEKLFIPITFGFSVNFSYSSFIETDSIYKNFGADNFQLSNIQIIGVTTRAQYFLNDKVYFMGKLHGAFGYNSSKKNLSWGIMPEIGIGFRTY